MLIHEYDTRREATDAETAAGRHNQVVILRAASRGTPLFIVPTPGGAAHPFGPLASLLTVSGPIYATQLPPLDHYAAVQQLAKRCVELIRQVQPRGPYRLAGHAIGGLIAYEAANELIGLDERVTFLGLIDSSLSGETDAGATGATLERIQAYCPQSLPIPVHLIEAQVKEGGREHRAWSRLLGSKARTRTVGASSAGLLHQPELAVLAKTIDAAIEQSYGQEEVRSRELNYDPAVAIQIAEGRASPIFCVPGAGANITSFMPLSTVLGGQSTLYGLQARGLDGELAPHVSVPACARMYLAAIRRIQPRGPYRLLGHSFGGWIAFEMAQMLASQGDQVDPLVLLDSQCPSVRRAQRFYGRVSMLMKLIAILEELSGKSLSLSREQLAPLSYDAQLVRLMESMKTAGLLARAGNVGPVRGMVRVFAANLNAAYVPAGGYSGRVLLVSPTEPWIHVDEVAQLDTAPKGPDEVWSYYAPNIEFVTTPGNHMTLLKQPNIEAIIPELRSLWNGLGAAAGSASANHALRRSV